MEPSVPDDFEQMWSDLAPVGRSASSGGYFRQPFTTAERELSAWFVEQADARGLRLEVDGFGNVVAWWNAGRSGGRPPGVLTGSHLDSVLDGGAYDGPLGVVSALAAVDRLRERGFRPGAADRGVGVRRGGGVAVRAGLSRVAARDRRDDVVEGPRAARPGRRTAGGRDGRRGPRGGGSPALAGILTRSAASSSCTSSRDVTSSTAGRRSGSRAGSGRTGATASTSPASPTMPARRGWRTGSDPMVTYAMTALAANKQARLAGQRATFGRVETTPNSTNSVPSAVTAWLDARCDSDRALTELVDTIRRQADERSQRDGTSGHGDPRVGLRGRRLRRRWRPDRRRPRERRLAGHPDPGRPRRRSPVGARDSERDALRPQPHRRLALARRARRDRRLPGRRRRARRDPRAGSRR